MSKVPIRPPRYLEAICIRAARLSAGLLVGGIKSEYGTLEAAIRAIYSALPMVALLLLQILTAHSRGEKISTDISC